MLRLVQPSSAFTPAVGMSGDVIPLHIDTVQFRSPGWRAQSTHLAPSRQLVGTSTQCALTRVRTSWYGVCSPP